MKLASCLVSGPPVRQVAHVPCEEKGHRVPSHAASIGLGLLPVGFPLRGLRLPSSSSERRFNTSGQFCMNLEATGSEVLGPKRFPPSVLLGRRRVHPTESGAA